MIIKKLEVGPFASNCYIVGDEESKQGIVIDPGDEAGRILNAVKDSGLDIKTIVLTHGHVDHTAAVREVAAATGARIVIHEEDVKTYGNKFVSIFLGIQHKSPPPPDSLLKDWDTVSAGKLNFSVIHTPGHSRGSICLLGEGVLFSGDTLFKCSIGRSDVPASGGDQEQLLESITKRLMVLEDDIKVYPGHGPETTIGAERRGNPFLV